MPVQVKVAQEENIPDTTEYLSILKSRHSANINPQVEGYITRIYVKSGDRVTAGMPLIQIDPLKQQAAVSGQEAARAAQEATVRYAQIQLDRERKLYAAGVVPKQDVDNAVTTYDAAVAQLKALSDQVNQQQVELHYYRVAAPTSGIVGDIPVRVGDRVAVTTLLTTVDEPGALEAYIYVPADRARNLKIGAPVHLVDGAGNKMADSRITFISSEVDPETQTVLAKAGIENAKGALRVSQQMRAQVVWSKHQGPVVLVTDALCFSATDIFAAGFQSNGIGPVLGIDESTGAGGANVQTVSELHKLWPNGPFRPLPGGAAVVWSLCAAGGRASPTYRRAFRDVQNQAGGALGGWAQTGALRERMYLV